jgi:hypothetical protein
MKLNRVTLKNVRVEKLHLRVGWGPGYVAECHGHLREERMSCLVLSCLVRNPAPFPWSPGQLASDNTDFTIPVFNVTLFFWWHNSPTWA